MSHLVELSKIESLNNARQVGLTDLVEKERSRCLVLEARLLSLQSHQCPDVSRLVDNDWVDGRMRDLQGKYDTQYNLAVLSNNIIGRMSDALRLRGYDPFQYMH
jgi:hypothetical protein